MRKWTYLVSIALILAPRFEARSQGGVLGVYLEAMDVGTVAFDTLKLALKMNKFEVWTGLQQTRLDHFLNNGPGLGVIHYTGVNLEEKSSAQRMIYQAEQPEDISLLKNYFAQRHPQSLPTTDGLRLAVGSTPGMMVSQARPSSEYHYGRTAYWATYKLKREGVHSPGTLVVTCTVYCLRHNHTLAEIALRDSHFISAEYQNFVMPFSIDYGTVRETGTQSPYRFPTGGAVAEAQSDDCDSIDLRVFWHGLVTTSLDQVIVEDGLAHELFTQTYDMALKQEAVQGASYGLHEKFYLFDEPKVSSFLGYEYVRRMIKDTLGWGNAKARNTTAQYRDFERFLIDAQPDELMIDPYFITSDIPHPNITSNAVADDAGIARWDAVTYLTSLQRSIDTVLAKSFRPGAIAAGQYNRQLVLGLQYHGVMFDPPKKYRQSDGIGASLRPPAPSELRLQYGLGMAYGAKGFMGFLYRTFENAMVEGKLQAWPGLVSTTLTGGKYINHSSNFGTLHGKSIYTGYNEKWAEVATQNARLAPLLDTLLALSWHGAKSWSTTQTSCGSWTNLVTGVSTYNTSGFVDGTPYVEVGHLRRGTTDYLVVVNRRCAPEDTRDIAVTISQPGTPKTIITNLDSLKQWDIASGTSFTDRFLPGQGKIYRLMPSALRSITNDGFLRNGQRKLVKDQSGVLHCVYESGFNIWYSRSTNNGVNWTSDIQVNAPNTRAKSPSIAFSNDGLNRVYIAYQSDSWGGFLTPCIIIARYEGGVQRWVGQVVGLNGFEFPVGPVIAAYSNLVLVLYKPTSADTLTGKELTVSDGGITSYYSVTIPNANGSSVNPSVCLRPTTGGRYHISYQQADTAVRYLGWRMPASTYGADPTEYISAGNGCSLNRWPSIALTTPPSGVDTPIVSWTGNTQYGTTAVIRRKRGASWSTTYKVGGMMTYTNATATSSASEEAIVGWWNTYGNLTQFVRIKNGLYETVRNLPSPGDIQLSGGSNFAAVKCAVFDNRVSPYRVNPLTYNFSTLQKMGVGELWTGREVIGQIGQVEIVASLGEVYLDDAKVSFVSMEAEQSESAKGVPDGSVQTEPFSLSSRSKLTFSSSTWVVRPGLATRELPPGREVDITVALVKATDNRPVVEYPIRTVLQSNVLDTTEVTYNVDCSHIEIGDYFLRLAMKSTEQAVFGYAEVQYDLSESLGGPEKLAVEGSRSEAPGDVRLGTNYPNPFNPLTTIPFSLPSRMPVTLTVFNTLGQQVAMLVEGEMDAGYHEAVFDATRLASGVYLYRLQAGSFVQTRKLVLVR